MTQVKRKSMPTSTPGRGRSVLFVIDSLTSGGAQRVLSIMLGYWCRTDLALTVFTLYDESVPVFWELPPQVTLVRLGIAGEARGFFKGIRNNWRRIRVLRRRIRAAQPDLAISFIDRTNVLTLLACCGTGIPVLATEHNDPGSRHAGSVWHWLRLASYHLARDIVVLTERSRSYFPRSLHHRVRVVPNPVPAPPAVSSATRTEHGRKRVIAVGRLGWEKGFDLLLASFGMVAKKHPEWDLRIVGDGVLRAELEKQRDRLGLQGRVTFAGRVKDVYAELRQADLFVLSSRHEGFPMALGEAMACGLPCIAADCPTGPREIIRDGLDGLLVPAEETGALAAAIERLMVDEAERRRLGAQAQQITERFGVERVMAEWDSLLLEAGLKASERAGR